METMQDRMLRLSDECEQLADAALRAARKFWLEGNERQYDRQMARYHEHSRMATVWYGRAGGIPYGCPY